MILGITEVVANMTALDPVTTEAFTTGEFTTGEFTTGTFTTGAAVTETLPLVIETYNGIIDLAHFHIVSGFSLHFSEGIPLSFDDIKLSGELFTGERLTIEKVSC